MWAQIQRLPDGCQSDSLISNLAGRIEIVDNIEMDVPGIGKFSHVRVKLDVNAPLRKFMTTSRKTKREFYLVRYEKIPKFYAACGLI